MDALDRAVDSWNEIEKEETHRLRGLTIPESLQMFAKLYEAYIDRFRAEEAEYLPERQRVLIARQQRLARLAELPREYPGESAIQSTDTPSKETG